jgi:hypothetical protein
MNNFANIYFKFNKKNQLIPVFVITFFILIYNFFFDAGYWYDEWATLFSSDPNVSLSEIHERIKGIYKGNYTLGSEENVPPYYYIILRSFFRILGFTAENGRIFSIIFFLLTILIYIPLSKKILGNKYFLPAVIMLALNPLLLWMANETRADTFVVFFSTANLYFFFRCINEKKKINYLFLILSNVVMLSVYPLTFSIFFSQIIFLIYCYFLKKKFKYLISLVIISFILYFCINYDYLFYKLHTINNHYAVLQPHFFIGFFFNTFFGNIYFGGIYLLFFLAVFFLSFKKIHENLNIIFLLILIISTYSMVIISSLFLTPIAAPRYIIFLIPALILWFNGNLFFFCKNSKKIFFTYFFIIIFSIINIFFVNNEKPVKKPPIKEALNIIKQKNIYYIYAGTGNYFPLYISTLSEVSKNQYVLIKSTNLLNKNINQFVYLCINNPRFAVGNLKLPDEPKCNIFFKNFYAKEVVKINDFKIIFFERK